MVLLWDLPFPEDLEGRQVLASSFEGWDRYPEVLVVHFHVGHQVRNVEDPFQDQGVLVLVLQAQVDGFPVHREVLVPENLVHREVLVDVVQEILVAAVEVVVPDLPGTWVSVVEVRPFADFSSSWTVAVEIVVAVRCRAVHLLPARRSDC